MVQTFSWLFGSHDYPLTRQRIFTVNRSQYCLTYHHIIKMNILLVLRVLVVKPIQTTTHQGGLSLIQKRTGSSRMQLKVQLFSKAHRIMCLARDTSYVESFNNVMNIFQDKRIAFSNAQYRTQGPVQFHIMLYPPPLLSVRQTRETMALDPYQLSEALASLSCDRF